MTMLLLDKLLGLAGVGNAIANISVLKRFLSGVTVIIALTAISSTMAGMIMTVALYGLYLGFVHYGLDPQAAVITVSGFAFIVTGVLAALAVIRWRQLRDMPRLMNLETQIVDRAGRLAEAFVNGLLAGHERRRR